MDNLKNARIFQRLQHGYEVIIEELGEKCIYLLYDRFLLTNQKWKKSKLTQTNIA